MRYVFERLKRAILRKEMRRGEEGAIDYTKFRKFEKNNAVILDVRSVQEYREGHLEGAIIIPEYEIRKNIEKKIENKMQLILIYCKSGLRSKIAYDEMKKLGYMNIYYLKNGLDGI